jgi:hypothetical protein
MARRQTEGLSKRDVLLCLKRFIAREVFNALKEDLLQNWDLTVRGPSQQVSAHRFASNIGISVIVDIAMLIPMTEQV